MMFTTRSLVSFALAIATTVIAIEQIPLKEDKRPNIVVILTDDQDLHMDSIDYMPLLKKHIINHGTFYKGGYPKFVAQGFNENWLPIWLQDAGYSTYYTGKLFNSHTVENWNSPHPSGWTSSDFLLDPFTYDYLNSTFQRNEHPPVSHEGEYSTDVLARKAYGLLEEAVNSRKPFFLTLAPIAPHSNVAPGTFGTTDGSESVKDVTMTAPIPAQRHKHLFPGAKVPRRANFNPEKPGGASWVKQLDRLTDEIISYNDDFYRARLQALQAVDEIIEGVVARLADYGILDNTYIIYTTDNGYHISQHRLPPGKECGFEEDINVPLVIRGPGVPIGEADIVTAHTDLAPTILKIAGGDFKKDDLDGSPIPLNKQGLKDAKTERQEHVNVEFWGRSIPEGIYKFSLDDGKVVAYGLNNTYKALRIVGKDYNVYYSVWCTNEHELYDLTIDPHQINNIHPSVSSTSNTILGVPLSKILPRLDALLMVTKSCKGQTCVDPWSVIHPNGQVKTLADALHANFDGFYASAADKVSFEKCELGYIVESEGPQALASFEDWKNEEL